MLAQIIISSEDDALKSYRILYYGTIGSAAIVFITSFMWPHYDKPVTKESMREIDTVVSSLRTTFTQIKRVYSDVKVVKLSVFYAVWFSVRMMVLIYWQLLFEELIGAKTNALVLGLVSVAGAVAALL